MYMKTNNDSRLREELAAAIDKFAHTKHGESPFATYSNGDRRSEQKTVDKVLQETVVASVTSALKDK
jgi:hypothetical protein